LSLSLFFSESGLLSSLSLLAFFLLLSLYLFVVEGPVLYKALGPVASALAGVINAILDSLGATWDEHAGEFAFSCAKIGADLRVEAIASESIAGVEDFKTHAFIVS
jgi:hypothetical protein